MFNTRNSFTYFIESLRLFGLEHFGKFYSIYRGIVVDNNDPEQRGRVLVKIPEIGENPIPTWAESKFYLQSGNKGIFIPPNIDDIVWVSFRNGDIRYPIYEGGYLTEQVDKTFQINYPNRRGIKTQAGHTIIIDDTKGDEAIIVKHKDNSYFMFDKDGGIIFGTSDGNYVSLSKVDGGIQIRNKDGNSVFIGSGGIQVIDKNGNYVNVNGTIDLISSQFVNIVSNLNVMASTVSLGSNAQNPVTGGGVFINDATMRTQLSTLLASITALITATGVFITALSAGTFGVSDPAAKGIFTAMSTYMSVVSTTLVAIQQFLTYLQTAESKSVKAQL
jgi:hypothetical protein